MENVYLTIVLAPLIAAAKLINPFLKVFVRARYIAEREELAQVGADGMVYEEAEAGKTTVMFFWASWCKSCKSLLPLLNKLEAAKGDRPVSFYLMNVWEDDDPMAYLKRNDVGLPVLLQAENVAQRYDIRVTPGIVVVDPERRIRYVRDPDESVEEIATKLQGVLGIALAPAPGTADTATAPVSSVR